MEEALKGRPGWRVPLLLLLVFGPLFALLFLYGKPIPQDPGYHIFADTRTCLGVPNFGNVASNVLFLAAGITGALWCHRRANQGMRQAWMVFFAGVALVFFGSGYYHRAPGDDSLVWDRLPMTVAFMGLSAAMLGEHLSGKLGRALLWPLVFVGLASVLWWRHTDDLRVYIWVQGMPLLVIPYLIAAYPGRYTHRHYLLYGLGFYALAKAAEYYDEELYRLTWTGVSGHSLKHLLAAAAPLCLYLMLRRRARKPA